MHLTVKEKILSILILILVACLFYFHSELVKAKTQVVTVNSFNTSLEVKGYLLEKALNTIIRNGNEFKVTGLELQHEWYMLGTSIRFKIYDSNNILVYNIGDTRQSEIYRIVIEDY